MTSAGVEGAEPIYRLVTSILDHEKAPAKELAALTAVRLKVEQNQLVAGIEEFFLGVRCLEGL